MDTKKDIKLIVKKFKKNIEKIIVLETAILFGSQATGKATENSDVDVIFVSKDFEGKKYFRRSPKLYLLWDYPCDIDIICLTPEEFEQKKHQIGIIKQAVKEGITI